MYEHVVRSLSTRRSHGRPRLIGLLAIEKPEALRGRGGVWFTCGAQQLHVGIADDFSPATKAHPAIPGLRRFYTTDRWGNRIELLAAD
jgi:hypothetical protein